MRTTTCNHPVRPHCLSTFPAPFSRHTSFPNRRSHLGFINFDGWGLYSRSSSQSISVEIGAAKRAKASVSSSSPWDDKPYEVLPDGKRSYLDEQDVATFLDPSKAFAPLNPASFNPAAYLWKKIEDIPEERRHRLLFLLKPRLISRAWEIAGTRYEDPKLSKKRASNFLSDGDVLPSLEYWYCRKSGGPMRIAWINFFKKAIFRCEDGSSYGRLIGGPIIPEFANSRWPLYFAVRQLKEVMSTEQPCDLAYEFGNGLLDIHEYPQDFPGPGVTKTISFFWCHKLPSMRSIVGACDQAGH